MEQAIIFGVEHSLSHRGRGNGSYVSSSSARSCAERGGNRGRRSFAVFSQTKREQPWLLFLLLELIQRLLVSCLHSAMRWR
jgi:hypothetical protein